MFRVRFFGTVLPKSQRGHGDGRCAPTPARWHARSPAPPLSHEMRDRQRRRTDAAILQRPQHLGPAPPLSQETAWLGAGATPAPPLHARKCAGPAAPPPSCNAPGILPSRPQHPGPRAPTPSQETAWFGAGATPRLSGPAPRLPARKCAGGGAGGPAGDCMEERRWHPSTPQRGCRVCIYSAPPSSQNTALLGGQFLGGARGRA